MRIVLGVVDNHLRPWEFIPDVEVMINNLVWRWSRPRASIVWVDSGGYQIMVKGLKISIERIIEKYRMLDADIYMSLDIPPRDLYCRDRELVKKNIENYEILRTRLEDKEIIPVIHSYSLELLLYALDVYRSLGAKMIAYGGVVPPTLARNGNGSRLIPIVGLALLVKTSRLPIHVLGLGSPTMINIVRVLGVHSCDTSTWRVKAAYGKILIPGHGERYVGNRQIRFGRVYAKSEEIEYLKESLRRTGFPYIDSVDNMLKTFEGRAIINAWIVVKLHNEFSPKNGFKWLYQKAQDLAKQSIDEVAQLYIELAKTYRNS